MSFFKNEMYVEISAARIYKGFKPDTWPAQILEEHKVNDLCNINGQRGEKTKTSSGIWKRIHKDEGVTQIRAALATTSSNIKGVSVITARDNVSVSMDEVRKLRAWKIT